MTTVALPIATGWVGVVLLEAVRRSHPGVQEDPVRLEPATAGEHRIHSRPDVTANSSEISVGLPRQGGAASRDEVQELFPIVTSSSRAHRDETTDHLVIPARPSPIAALGPNRRRAFRSTPPARSARLQSATLDHAARSRPRSRFVTSASVRFP